MYEYLVENLISYRQVGDNLRRTADRGLISNLYRKQMNTLALKYFGVDKNGNYTENKEDIVSYRCPYSGELINDLSTAHLEHILPVSSNGGTILFNCIPVLDKVNLSKRNESNLLSWWQEQDYFSYDRLERLVKYMFEAYNLSFKETNEEELYDYEDSSNDDDYIEQDDLSLDLRSKTKKINKLNQNITYYQLLTDMINELSKNRDVSKYYTELNSLKEQNIFENINEIEKMIKAVQTIFKEKLGDDSKRHLSYSLNINMNKLHQSLKSNDYENEIRERINYIESLLNNNNKKLFDYFEGLSDMTDDINLLYANSNELLNSDTVTIFLNNLSISHKSKINIFIEMLSEDKYTSYQNGKPDDKNIFGSRNKLLFKGYEHINGLNTSQLWSRNSSKIISTIESKIKYLTLKEIRTPLEDEELEKLKKAKKHIVDYEFDSQFEKRIEVYIDMLSEDKYTSYQNGKPDDKNIFGFEKKVPFKGYEHINGLNTSQFWKSNSSKIISTIESKIKYLTLKEIRTPLEDEELEKLKKAKKHIVDFEFDSQLEKKIEVYIDMLSEDKYTSYQNGKPDDKNIFGIEKKVPFKGYKHINGLNTSQFWHNNSSKIISTIESKIKYLTLKEIRTPLEDEELEKLKKAKKHIVDYEFDSQLEKKIEVYIDMLSEDKYTSYQNGKPDDKNIFGSRNKVLFKGYEHINGLNTSQFWIRNSSKIISTIESKIKYLTLKEIRTPLEDEELEKLKKTKKHIVDYEFDSQLEKKIEVYIDMLSEDKYTSYQNGKPDDKNIFGSRNKVQFKGYEHINGLNTSQFWSRNSSKIISTIESKIKYLTLKEEISDLEKIELEKLKKAESNIIEYLNLNRRKKKQPEFKTIDEYIDTLDKTKKEAKALIELRDSWNEKIKMCIIENNEMNEYLNTSNRRAI